MPSHRQRDDESHGRSDHARAWTGDRERQKCRRHSGDDRDRKRRLLSENSDRRCDHGSSNRDRECDRDRDRDLDRDRTGQKHRFNSDERVGKRERDDDYPGRDDGRSRRRRVASSMTPNHHRFSRHANGSRSPETGAGHTSREREFDERREMACLKEYLDSGECLLARGSDELAAFWQFHTMYTRRLAASSAATTAYRGTASAATTAHRAATDAASSTASHPTSTGAPFPLPPYSIEHSNPLRIQRRVRDKRDAREQERERREQLEPEARRAKQVLAAYLHFLQQQKFSKLKKLRDSQRNLPIFQHKEEILSAVRDNSVLIIAGDTGCGKSTQLPQYLIAAGYRSIACTQPRRIACVSLCQRVSHETLQQYGDQIGYQIRFDKRRTARTRAVFLTEGLLLRQVTADPLLSQYDVVVLDEVHERHLQGDFLLGVVKCLTLQRPELRVVLMSATINIQLFSDYFHGRAPVIQIPGRLYPIQLLYRPISVVETVSSGGRLNPAPFVRVLSLIDERYPEGERGDLLVFLSGVAEITAVADACTEYAQQNGRWLVLPLHSSLAVTEQDKVFALAPDGVRKCIVSTNIAETSVTIDGVRFVCDSGKVKEMSYDSATRMQRLKEFWVSQASAEQRKGRAGRTGPGVCFRMFSEDEYDMLAAYSTPEIQRVPLESLVLQMVAMGLPDPRRFPFLDRPPEDSLEEAIRSLVQQGALTASEHLTPLGQMLSQLPVDITVGKMLVLGSVLHQMGPTLTAAAALSIQSPLTNRAFRDPDCLANLKQLHCSHGDPLTLLEAFVSWLQVKIQGKVRSRSWCSDRGIEEQRFYELTKLRRQFLTIMEESRLLPRPARLLSSADRVRRHGELAQLRAARRQLRQQRPQQHRLGRPHAAADPQPADDISDIDFRMRSDDRELQELLKDSKLSSYQDQTLLKVIMSSGLYPNFALPDLHNSYKSGADMVFHCPSKPFVVLHPNSVLAFSPEVLQIDDSDVVMTSRPRPPRHSVCSNRHQMLAFVSLLETSKPYVTGVTRVPALQVSLLFSNTIDTDITFSTLCCDQWVEFLLRNMSDAQQLVARAITLRQWWSQLLRVTLNNLDSGQLHESDEQTALRDRLVAAFSEYLHTDVFYSYRRLAPADLSAIYTDSGRPEEAAGGATCSDSGELEEAAGAPGQPQLPHYLRYDTLTSDMSVVMDEEACPHCEQTLSALPVDRVNHWRHCIYQHSKTDTKQQAEFNPCQEADDAAGGFYCPVCKARLDLTPIQVLQHKRSHRDADLEPSAATST